MSYFKMSDVFDLPVKRVEGGVYPMLYNADDNLVFVSKADYVDAAVIAINSHDKLTEQNKLLREALELVVDKLPMCKNTISGYAILLSNDDFRIIKETLNISEL